jgi:uncharacterized membrane protein required for colicin V production
MVSVFWIFLALFAVIGTLRGWAKEIVATAGIVLALFALQQFGAVLFPGIDTTTVTDEAVLQAQQTNQFAIQTVFLLTVTFFAYQTPAVAAQWVSRRGGRFADRLSAGLQQRILGLVVGLINGWLVIGSIWFYAHQLGYPFGEFVIPPPPYSTPSNLTLDQLLVSAGYPEPSLSEMTSALVSSLPLTFLADPNNAILLPLLVVILFLFVIIVMI